MDLSELQREIEAIESLMEKATLAERIALASAKAQVAIAEQLERIADSADYQDSVTGWKMEREEVGK